MGKYGVVGKESEIPARLEEMNKSYSTKLLISEATFSRLVPNIFLTRPIDYVCPHEGHEGQSQLVYEVMDRLEHGRQQHPLYEAAALHAQAMQLYRDRDFAESVELFQQAHELIRRVTGQSDVPSLLLLRRSRAYVEQPPPPEWDGIWAW